MLAKDQVINTYRALNNWRSFRLKLFIEGIIIGILSGLIIFTPFLKTQTGIGLLFGSSL